LDVNPTFIPERWTGQDICVQSKLCYMPSVVMCGVS